MIFLMIKKKVSNLSLIQIPHIRNVLAHLHTSSFLFKTGWLLSIKEKKPIDNDGNKIPWLTYSFLTFMKPRLTKDLTLFEYGAGYSTYYFSERVSHITTIEYDKKWHDFIKDNLAKNVDIIYQDKDINDKYCRKIKTLNKTFDIILVDGRDRVNCIKQSIDCLTSNGVLILDDSQRDRYQEGIDFLHKKGFKSLEFEGLKAAHIGLSSTTIFYRTNNCFNI